MKAQRFIQWLTIVLVAISLGRLSLTYFANSQDADIEAITKGDAKAMQSYKDSISDQNVFLWYTYNDLQKAKMNLGLDLQGGMNVVMEVSVGDVIKALAGNTKDANFQQVLDKANEFQRNSQEDYVASFVRAFKEVNPNQPLNRPFAIRANAGKIGSSTSDDDVVKYLNEQAKDAIDRSLIVLHNRIDKFGVVSPNIRRQQGTGRILIELAGVSNPERVRKLLQTAARLEFWETYEAGEIMQTLVTVDEKLRGISKKESKDKKETSTDSASLVTGAEDTTAAAATTDTGSAGLLSGGNKDTAAKATVAKGKDGKSKEIGLFNYLAPNVSQGKGGTKVGQGSVVGYALPKDTARLNALLASDLVKMSLPRDLKLLWTVKAEPITEDEGALKFLKLIAVKNTINGEPPLEGSVITDASIDVSQSGRGYEVNMSMDSRGARKWAELTTRNAPRSKDDRGRDIAIVLDNYVYSFPTVNTPITGGRSNITGNFTVDEANDLSNVLKSGKLPAPAKIIEESVVGPTLGEEAISSGLMSSVLGFLVVMGFMIFYYRKGGTVAVAALFVNLALIFGIMAYMGAVLTLPGIAGIVLSMGMAVDCNVLIYERIKEEMEKTADKAKAISDGFTHAYSSIIDSQATTFITGLILFSFGTGPILGFATTLMLGIVTSLFTGILVSRLIMEKLLAKGQVINFIAEGKKGLFHGANYNILGKRKYMYIFSSVFIIIGIVSLFTNGLNYGVDFKGGRTYTIQLPVDKEINSEEVRKGLNEVFAQSSPEVKTVAGFTNRYKIATKEKIEINTVEADQEVAGMVYDGLKTFMGTVSKEDFVGSDKYIIESRKVGPTIVDDIKWGALQAVFWSILAIGVYLLIRFKRWYYSMGAALALFHDVFFIITLYTVLWKVMPFSLEVDQNFIAAILTIIGYSVNDTVVVFDRLREYLRENSEEDAEVVINRAMNATLSRTIITVLTVLLTAVILLFFGGEALRGFSFSLSMGLIIGTYSSVFIASALVLDLSKRFEGGKVKE